MASENYAVGNDTPNPHRIRLTHWDDSYAGDYDYERGVLRLFHRGGSKEYPLNRLAEKFRKRDAVVTPAATDGGE